MENHRTLSHFINAKGTMNLIGSILLVVILVVGNFGIADAKREYTDAFNKYYGTFGVENGTTMGSCITCHNQPDGKGKYNPYGIDYLVNGFNFGAIESLDSDNDGFDNLTEILEDSWPGDPGSIPQPGNSPPVADAGPDQTVQEASPVTLDGSGSFDSDGTIASYRWRQISGVAVTLSDVSAVRPAFTAPASGSADEVLTFELTVTDDTAQVSTDTCIVTVNWVNDPPVADAGPDQTVGESSNATLDGSNSTDPDGNLASYAWVQKTGIAVTLSDATAAKPTFTSPVIGSGGAALTFELTVTDSLGLTAVDSCIVNVVAGNKSPVADAGIDQTVDEGSAVTLDGSNSSDPDGVIVAFQWTQAAGTPVVLSDATAARPTFTAPDVGPGSAALTFNLTITDDGGLQSSDTCIVNVSWINLAPVANAGSDQTGASSVEEGSMVKLDGTGSVDSDDGIAAYLWQQVGGGPAVTLSDPAAAQPSFVTPPVDAGEATLTFRLTVTDNGGLQATDEVLVTIYDNGIGGFPTDVITTTSAGGIPIGIVAGTGGSITEFATIDPGTLPDASVMPEDLLYGLLDLKIKTDVSGGTATAVVHLANPAPDGYKWYKYNALTRQWIDYSATDVNGTKGAVFNAARDQVTLTLVDNGPGDDDGSQNGIIADPSGLGAASSSIAAGFSNDFGGSSGCFIGAASTDKGRSPFTPELFIGGLLILAATGCTVWTRFYLKAKKS